MEVRLRKRDVIWSYIGTILSMSANLLMLPVIIYYLDANMMGLWYVFVSIGAIALLFDFGFGVTFARNITYCWSGAGELKKEDVVFVENREPDFFLMKKVLRACKVIYLRLSCSALLLLITIGLGYILYISREIKGYEHIIAWIIYSVAVFLNLYYGYYAAFLRGVGAIDQANQNTVIARSAQILVTVILLILGFGIIGVCVAFLTYGTLFRMLGKWKFYRYQHIGENLTKVKEKITRADVNPLVGIVWHNAWRDGLISITNYLSNQATVIISSLYLTLVETGVYSIGVQIAMAIAAISGTFYMASQPQLQAAYINHDIEKIRNTMAVIVTSLIYIFVVGVIAVLLVVLPLLRLIKPEAIVSVPVLLGLCTYHFILQFRNCYTSYFSCLNRILYLKAFIMAAVLCVVLSVFFTGYFKLGVWGLIAAQIISQMIYNVWHWPILSLKEMNISLDRLLLLGNSQLMLQVQKVIKKKFLDDRIINL